MSLSSYNPHDRYRNRFKQRFMRVFVFGMFVGGLVAGGFFLGQRYGIETQDGADQELIQLREERLALHSQITDLQAEMKTAEVQFSDVILAYKDVLPDGELEPFVDLIRAQLKKGVNSLTLQRAIETVQSPRQCSDPEVLRVIAKTPAYEGPENDGVLKGADIRVSASGASAQNDSNEPEAWYDPAQKVGIVFQLPNSLQKKKSGVMPFDYSFIEEDKEYRFHIETGVKSFVKLTYDICEL